VEWRERVAREKRAAFRDESYWGRPLPGFGDPAARVLILGLAPAAHGGNRTGRIFTGDRSGDWLFAAMYRVGMAVQPTSTHAGDGQRLRGVRVAAAVRCAPPVNKPLPIERDTCFPWLVRETELCAGTLRSVVALGSYAWDASLRALAAAGYAVPRPKPRFGHGAEAVAAARGGAGGAAGGGAGGAAGGGAGGAAGGGAVGAAGAEAVGAAGGTDRSDVLLVGSYHPSQQNTFTGKLTETMLDAVLTRAKGYAGLA
jgi:uracil-DNA glycosylase